MSISRYAAFVAIFIGSSIFWTAAVLADTALSESQVKAAYLYKFAAYVEWPPAVFARPDMPITIGVIGENEIVDALSALKGEYTIVAKVLKPGEPLTGVNILYIGRQENGRLKQLLESVESLPVFTVTDSAGALQVGSILNFVSVDDRIRFEISVAHAEHSNLKISARLLGVAQRIETGS